VRSLLAVVILVGAAVADEDPTSRARALFDSGRRHFELTEYEAALEDFKEGYRLKDNPVFLYNIGLCHRLMNHKEEALLFFKSYRVRQPDAPEIDRRIAVLEQEITADARAKVEMPRPPPPAPLQPALTAAPKTPIHRKWWLWTTVGGVVAGSLAVGLGVGLTRGSGEGRYTFPRVQF
jgi:tetratricopeptide (TPR) repeat protein